MTRRRSPRAAAASRRNGARSRGPRTAQGKATSAQNARRHGLFAPLTDEQRAASSWPGRIADLLAVSGEGGEARWLGSEIAVNAALRLEEATRLVCDLQGQLGAALAMSGSKEFDAILGQLARMSFYQRRFRGRRDRALRSIAAQTRWAQVSNTPD